MRWAFPHHYAGSSDGRLGLYCQPGNQEKRTRPADGSPYLKTWVTDAPPRDWVWTGAHVLRFMRPGDAHTIEV